MILTKLVILVTGWSMLLPRIEYWWVHFHWVDMGRSFWFTLQSSNFAPPRQGLRRLRLGSQGCVSWWLGGDWVPSMEPWGASYMRRSIHSCRDGPSWELNLNEFFQKRRRRVRVAQCWTFHQKHLKFQDSASSRGGSRHPLLHQLSCHDDSAPLCEARCHRRRCGLWELGQGAPNGGFH